MEIKVNNNSAKNFYSSRYLLLVSMLYITLLLASTVLAYKIVHFSWFALPGSAVIFPLSYALGDVITEVYGYKIMRQLIWLSILCGYFFIISITFVLYLPSSDPILQNAFDLVFRNFWLFTTVATIGMLVSAFVNSYAMAKWKILFQGRYFWMRSLGATCLGDLASILIVVLLAFMPVEPFSVIPKLILSMYLYRVAYAVFAITPAAYIANILKRKENIDIYDYDTNFNPLAFKA